MLPACFICKGTRLHAGPTNEVLGQKFTIYRCRGCGLVTTDPMPTPEYLSRYYGSNQALGESGFDIAKLKADHERNVANPDPSELAVMEAFLDLMNDAPADATVLDVGCNLGTRIEQLQKRCRYGFHGVELNREAYEFCLARGKFPIECKMLEDEPFAGVRFDAICLYDVFEHLPDPETFIGTLASRLKPSGFIVLTLPNAGSAAARVMNVVMGLKGKGHFPTVTPPFHLNGFSRGNLELLFGRHGFKVAASRTYLQHFPPGTYERPRVEWGNLNLAVGRLIGKLDLVVRDDKLFIGFGRG